MKRAFPLGRILALMFASAHPGTSQEAAPARFLSVVEVTGGGSLYPLPPDERRGIVDLGSSLRIRLDKDALRVRLLGRGSTGGELERVAAAMLDLSRIASTGLEAARALERAMGGYVAEPTPERLMEVRRDLGPADDAVQATVIAAAGDARLAEGVERALEELPAGTPMAERLAVLFGVVRRRAEALRERTDGALRSAGVTVRLGGWHVTSDGQHPLHLEGFDDYAPRAPVDVPRWTLVLSDEQRTTLARLESLARENRDEGARLGAIVPEPLLAALRSVPGAARRCGDDLRDALAEARRSAGLSSAREVGEADDALGAFLGFADVLRARYAGATPTPSLVPLAAQDLQALVASLARVVTTLEALGSSVRDVPALLEVALPVEACVEEADRLLSGLAAVRALVESAQGARVTGTTGLALADSVRRLDLAGAPESTELALRDLGPREAGDRIVVRLEAGGAEGAAAPLETWQVELERVDTHVTTRVGLIFADPRRTTLSARFQPGASYSYIVSRGSRGSSAYNRLFRLGLALNMSALDLDKDDVPELGIAVGLSVLRSIGEVGYGYDVGVAEPFWYFSVNLASPGQIFGGGS